MCAYTRVTSAGHIPTFFWNSTSNNFYNLRLKSGQNLGTLYRHVEGNLATAALLCSHSPWYVHEWSVHHLEQEEGKELEEQKQPRQVQAGGCQTG